MANVAKSSRKLKDFTPDDQNQAAQTRLKVCADRDCVLWVSTALESCQPSNPATQPEDLIIGGVTYRRLSPDYFLWLQARFESFQRTVGAATPDDPNAAEFARRFESLRLYVQSHYCLDDLDQAEQRLTAAAFPSPNHPARGNATPALQPKHTEPAVKTGFLFPPNGDLFFNAGVNSFTVPVTSAALKQVDAIRSEALRCGWTEAELYQNRSSIQFPNGPDYGVVCFIKPGHKLGAVTPHSIQVVTPGGHSFQLRRRNHSPMSSLQPQATQEARRS